MKIAEIVPKYWKKSLVDLKKSDEILASVINKFPNENLKKSLDPFKTLVYSIIGQQISVSAANSIKKKFKSISNIDPSIIIKISDDKLRECGLSYRKIQYIKNVSNEFISGGLNSIKFEDYSDHAIKTKLIFIKGIGDWTADMFLINFLNRPNILPIGDAGIINSIKNLYGIEYVEPQKLEMLRELWTPWCTTASFFLWKNLDTKLK